jgi:hypothetical protein
MGHRQGENRHPAALFPVMLDELAQEIERYLQLLDAQDTNQDVQPHTKAHDVQRALRQLRERQATIQTDVEQRANNRSSALVQTEP